ncbi:hypothetical protein AMJ57_03560 [Parcubacteria bacterium SG8_24]|nr:MAG: hypothetical protein AMJ57_03560 [Parcubacteria bacterium SG8_24]
MSAVTFFLEALRDRHVAAPLPSSRFLVRRLVRHLDLPDIRTVVELGPGEGSATLPLLRHLRQDARYIAVERNPRFAERLRSIDDRRLKVVEGDARRMTPLLEEVGVREADAVIASIPFTLLNGPDRRQLVRAAHDLLRPDGKIVIFHQYSPLMFPYLKREFRKLKTEFEPLNILPCWLIAGTR